MKDYEDKISAWAIVRPMLRTILVTGSQARKDHPADVWSDLDIDMYVTDFPEYLSSGQFVNEFGAVWLCHARQSNEGDPQFLVLYEGGVKIDFTFFPVSFLQEQVDNQRLLESQQRGYRVLIDKDNLAKFLPPQIFAKPVFEKPTAEAFQTTIESFWHQAVAVAKQIRRRNLWVVKTQDWVLKQHLFQMLEWHAQTVNRRDTWYSGHFMHEWTDPETWRNLHRVFGHFSHVESWQALLGTIVVFRRMAVETAKYLNYNYPENIDELLDGYVQELFTSDIGER